jgi:CRP-like cAMP-binding protein
MNHKNSQIEKDFEKLGRLKMFSWLNPVELKTLGSALAMSNHSRGRVISDESLGADQAHILVAGIARITYLNASDESVTVALLPPGPIFELTSVAMSGFKFRCEAYRDCRVGTLDWKAFDGISSNGSELAFRRFHQNDLKYCYRLLRRTSSSLDPGLTERVAITMLDLAEGFGIEDSRGMLLSISPSHREIADIVGASRPRVTECLTQMERDHLLFRQGRTFIVNAEKLSSALAATAGFPSKRQADLASRDYSSGTQPQPNRRRVPRVRIDPAQAALRFIDDCERWSDLPESLSRPW